MSVSLFEIVFFWCFTHFYWCFSITSPLILIAIAGTFYVGFRLNKRHQEKSIVLLGKELTLAQLYGVVMLCSMPVYYLVGAHGAMFWVLGASFTVIMLHATFYNIDAVAASQGGDGFPLLEQV